VGCGWRLFRLTQATGPGVTNRVHIAHTTGELRGPHAALRFDTTVGRVRQTDSVDLACRLVGLHVQLGLLHGNGVAWACHDPLPAFKVLTEPRLPLHPLPRPPVSCLIGQTAKAVRCRPPSFTDGVLEILGDSPLSPLANWP
jgi:hypothetical protein